MVDFTWVENKKPWKKKDERSLAKLDPCSVWRAPGRLGIGLIVINITSSYCMSVIIYTCFTESNRSCARPPRVGTRFGFILARYYPLASPFSFHPFSRSLIASSHHSPFRIFVFWHHQPRHTYTFVITRKCFGSSYACNKKVILFLLSVTWVLEIGTGLIVTRYNGNGSIVVTNVQTYTI